jgi:hypothetical protein
MAKQDKQTDLKAARAARARADETLSDIRRRRASYLANQGMGAQDGVYAFVIDEANARAALAAAERDFARAEHAAQVADPERNALVALLRREVVQFRDLLEDGAVPPVAPVLADASAAAVAAYCDAQGAYVAAIVAHRAALAAAHARIATVVGAVYTAQNLLTAARRRADGFPPRAVLPQPKIGRDGMAYDVPRNIAEAEALCDALDAPLSEPDCGKYEFVIESANEEAEEAAARRELAAE